MSKATNKNINLEDLRQVVREEVVRALQTLTDDPDAGLELREEIKEQLEQARQTPDEDLIPLEEVKKKTA
ncbi:MAG: hypothetical protein WD335_03745 [Candidatus Paceibacterota bacterium]